jgi:hypothetical protein
MKTTFLTIFPSLLLLHSNLTLSCVTIENLYNWQEQSAMDESSGGQLAKKVGSGWQQERSKLDNGRKSSRGTIKWTTGNGNR